MQNEIIKKGIQLKLQLIELFNFNIDLTFKYIISLYIKLETNRENIAP